MDGSAITLDLRRWWRRLGSWPLPVRCALVAGVAAHICFFLLIGVQPWHTLQEPQVRGFIEYMPKQAGVEALLNEQSVLFDTEPMLLHTAWNYRGSIKPESMLADQEDFFAPYPPKTALGNLRTQANASSVSALAVEVASRWEQVFSPLEVGLFEGVATPSPPLERDDPALQVNVLSLSDGSEQIFRLPVAEDSSARQLLWTPLQVQLLIGAGGDMSEPLIVRSSGEVSLDRELILAMLPILRHSRLPEGYYTVVIEP